MTTNAKLTEMVIRSLDADQNMIAPIAEFSLQKELRECNNTMVLLVIEQLCKKVIAMKGEKL